MPVDVDVDNDARLLLVALNPVDNELIPVEVEVDSELIPVEVEVDSELMPVEADVDSEVTELL
ncbi:hypothetical protein, partial [Burkholderia ambifaria]|uniref:hypothetical protein n=3 Tax=Burkholderia TaxID=32008 RepID=UPI0039E5816A